MPGKSHAPALYNVFPKNYEISCSVWYAPIPPTYIFRDERSWGDGTIGQDLTCPISPPMRAAALRENLLFY